MTDKTNTKSINGKKPWMNIFLFFTTILTVFAAGGQLLNVLFVYIDDFEIRPVGFWENIWLEAVKNGVIFSASLMGILLAHEMGHYLFARKNKVAASLPYFIPLPPPFFLGTMGAIIVMKGRIKSKNALMEIGAAGPLAGMVVAILLLFIGLANCPVGPIPEGGFIEGQSLLYIAAKKLMIGTIPDGYDIYLDAAPMVWAAWAGMLVTMINLFPVGQLDGGHVFYALFGKAHQRIAQFFLFAVFALGAGVALHGGISAYLKGFDFDAIIESAMPGVTWFVFGGMLALVFRRRKLGHPPTGDADLSTKHKLIGYLCIVVFIITFMPVVMRPAY